MSTNQVKVGWRAFSSPVVSGTDTDAQAFITAASITDSTQQSAINTLVTQLKTYGIWTKMKALYPMVGGTAASHKFNLKDPRDLDAAYRLVFNGGWVHSSNGALPNGTTGYADTKFIIAQVYPSSITNIHVSYYSKTNTNKYEMIGMQDDSVGQGSQVYIQDNGAVQYYSALNTNANSITLNKVQSSIGHYLTSRTSLTSLKGYRDGVIQGSNTNTSSSSNLRSTLPFVIGATIYKLSSIQYYYGNKESAFASIGDGLTDAEAANFYTAVQTFQSTLGRQIGAPIVADADAQAFLNAAVITDGTQASAVNTLVVDLKSAGVWTKMKALYPMVGGTAASHKFNLKDPRDLDAAYRLVFNGGWIHSSNGALPNGTTGYANTFFNPFNNLSIDNTHMSYYSRTNNARDSYDMGVTITNTNPLRSLHTVLKWGIDGNTYWSMGFQNLTSLSSEVDLFLPSSAVNFLFNKTSSTSTSLFANNTKYTASVTNRGLPNGNLYLGARNLNGFADLFANRQSAFASIGDGLTDAEAAAFYTAVQKYQTTLGRAV
jgi:hypothetical protein